MRHVRPLLLTLTASAGLAALIAWSTTAWRFNTASQDTEALLSALFDAEAQLKNKKHQHQTGSVPTVPPPIRTVDPHMRIALQSQRPLRQVSTQNGADCRNQGGIPVPVSYTHLTLPTTD